MQQIYKAVSKLDLFALPVSLTYKGQRSFTTFGGGLLSILVVVAFLAYQSEVFN